MKNETSRTFKFKVFLAFAIIYVMWGSTYLAIRFAIETHPPFLMAGVRFVVSGIFLMLWQYRKDHQPASRGEIAKSSLVGILLIVGGNGVLVWCEQYIPSGLAALILAIIPIWMVLLDSLFVVKKRPDWITISGILLGVAGVALLSGIDSSVLLANSSGGNSVFYYALVLMLAGLSWATGSLYSRTIRTSGSLLRVISIQMLSGGIFLMIQATFLGEWSQIELQNISMRSLLSLVYLIFFGTLLTYSAYNWLLRKSAPAKVGTYAFFNPLVAVLLGWIFAGEDITLRMIGGAVCILSAVLLVTQSNLFRNVLRQTFPRLIPEKLPEK